MLEQVLNRLQNWFRVRDNVNGIHPGNYTIKDGNITLPFLLDGQYFRIMGSVLNDGLYRYGPDMEYLQDETFAGTIWALAIPREIVKLAAEMQEWNDRNGAKSMSIYQSESKADYNYSKYTNGRGGQITVWDVFQERLKPYQKIREI